MKQTQYMNFKVEKKYFQLTFRKGRKRMENRGKD
jgi:hypothetical protein